MKKKVRVKREPEDFLLEAVGKYVKAKGGLVVVAGPTTIQELSAHQFILGVKCSGRRPPKPPTAKEGA